MEQVIPEPEGMIGFNIMAAMRHYEDYVKAAVSAGADLIVSGTGLPVDLPGMVKQAEKECGRKNRTMLAPIVSTEKAAAVILKYWSKQYGILPDLLVIEGPLAGGHLGFSVQQIAEFGGMVYEEEIRKILAL